jgi:hypothetical protein
MASLDMTVVSSVLALLRRDVVASCVADRFGVTEAQVLEWQDVFVVAGVLALSEFQRGGKVFAHLAQESPAQQPAEDEDPGIFQSTKKPPTTLPPSR